MRPCAIALCLLVAGAALATGPQNAAVVVNADNPDSVALAQEYAGLRGIPASHVIALSGVPATPKITVAQFRDLILRPLLRLLEERGLRRQTDCVIYSCGFPFAVDVSADMAGRKFARIITQPASLTGLTYLYELVLAADTDYLAVDSNRYFRRLKQQAPPPTFSTAEQDLQVRLEGLLRQVQRAQREAAEKKAPPAPEVAGWIDQAAAILQTLTASHRSPDLLYDLACLLALQHRTEEAMAALTAAYEAGWWNATLTARDSDLTALRERPDFKALLQRMGEVVVESEPPLGFRGEALWSPEGQPEATAGGRHYLLSAMLGYVGGPANTLAEVRECLRRARSADGTCPAGTVYYMVSTDWARTGPRQPVFASAAAALARLGVRAEVLPGVLPQGKPDVAGAMIGSAGFRWPDSGSTILPGAFCDHLTSFGGVMTGAGQTLLSEFIRYGAAGACGTVTEPYATPVKFPTPFLHVYYAAGCSLAEAFYLSVSAPYQQLLVGDPLCRPWAKPPAVTLQGLREGETVAQSRWLSAAAAAVAEPVRYELYVDGVRRHTCDARGRLRLDLAGLAAGEHEATVVCSQGLLAVPGSVTLSFRVGD